MNELTTGNEVFVSKATEWDLSAFEKGYTYEYTECAENVFKRFSLMENGQDYIEVSFDDIIFVRIWEDRKVKIFDFTGTEILGDYDMVPERNYLTLSQSFYELYKNKLEIRCMSLEVK